jgi:hypothetical protein
MEIGMHVELSSGWMLWRTLAIRGAGFPAGELAGLASRPAFEAVERVRLAADTLQRRCELAITQLAEAIENSDPDTRPAIGKRLRRLRAGGIEDPMLEDVAAAYREARGTAEQVLAAERRGAREHLVRHARDPRLRAAIAWQNRGALQLCLDLILRDHERDITNSKARGRERMLAMYLQRYCAKNDTIGFFGPVGWATIASGGANIALRPGADLLASRTQYFELWGIDALATALAADPAIRPWLIPRRHPAMWLDGTTLHHPIDRRSTLPAEFAAVLERCGELPANAIAASVIGVEGIADEQEVYDILDELVEGRIVLWTLEVPPHVEHPDRVLEAQLAALGPAGAPAIAKLARLQVARDEVGRAGEGAGLDLAFANLERVFTEEVAASPVRRQGATYAGRTLLYEDCRRDLEAVCDETLFERFAQPLSLVLDSARWFTHLLAERFLAAFLADYRELANGSDRIDFLTFWERASAHFSGRDRVASSLVATAASELQRRWSSLLGLDGEVLDGARLDVTVAAIRDAAARSFAAPGPGWPSAIHHSPDLMIAASSVDATNRGDFIVVLGEVHVASVTLAPWMARQHPDPGVIDALIGRDRTLPVVEAVVSKERATRSDRFSTLPIDFDLEIGGARSWRPRAQVLEAGSLVVELEGESLIVKTRDGARSFAIEQVVDGFLSNEVTSHFKLLPSLRHRPRVTLDGLVLGREAWRFEAGDLGFAAVDDPLDRLVAVRRWALQHRLPRYVFYRVPTETKPMYLDFESPHYIELFVHHAKATSELEVSEMLPAVDDVWLVDRAGARYSCELRVVAVDRRHATGSTATVRSSQV